MAAKTLIPPKYYDERFLNGFYPTGHKVNDRKKSIKIWSLHMDENWVISQMAAIGRENR